MNPALVNVSFAVCGGNQLLKNTSVTIYSKVPHHQNKLPERKHLVHNDLEDRAESFMD